ncbi:CLUMA_CG008472, isoform A [Clunio marinus]|uniref:CLUMA_CG008472, isoform A n=1 Tax=Clunio marinus TaxID=568069 RepID=A0A1J1I3V3_9DIPT|nr:CLUMA_CG008472, isoform A [Clunio marinus]
MCREKLADVWNVARAAGINSEEFITLILKTLTSTWSILFTSEIDSDTSECTHRLKGLDNGTKMLMKSCRFMMNNKTS